MAYLFKDDKTKLPIEKTKKLLWEGDGSHTSGVSLNFETLGINPLDYSFMCFVGGDGNGDAQADIIFPARQWFTGMLTFSDVSYDSQNVTCTIKEVFRKITYYPDDNGGTLRADQAIERLHHWTQSSTNTFSCGVDTSNIIPMQLWGIM